MKFTSKGPLKKGYTSMVTASGNPEMMGMEFGVQKMEKGEMLTFSFPQEVVYDLLSGEVTFAWEESRETVRRTDCFHEGAVLLHVPQNTTVTVTALADTEIAIVRTENGRTFPAVTASKSFFAAIVATVIGYYRNNGKGGAK